MIREKHVLTVEVDSKEKAHILHTNGGVASYGALGHVPSQVLGEK